MQPLEILKRYWGFDGFRPLQSEIIQSVLDGHDTLALLPTGGGKSICFQVPAMALDGVCIVVSPLIALMHDQVQRLVELGIPAACLVSGQNSVERELVLNHCLYGQTKLLYVSPERLKVSHFLAQFRQMKISLIVVDEAHCISQWGYDFRPPYLEIAVIRQLHPTAPVLALTATATPLVVSDIQQKLHFHDHRFFQQSFARANLSFRVLREEDKVGRLIRIARYCRGSGIVYVRSRKSTQAMADNLLASGISATAYHAGLDNNERALRQQAWMDNKVQIVVATNAFGMGIDKPDVRFVVHLDIPDSPEAYFQEAGRAGRDGEPAFAIILYEESDFERLDNYFTSNFPSVQFIKNVYRAICNYYQIPIGVGGDLQYDFDLVSICQAYHFPMGTFYSAVRFLEREGLLLLPLREQSESRLYIPISREELYKFQVGNKRYGELLKVVLRLYGGLFTEYVFINEKEIARRCSLKELEVVQMLDRLNTTQVISYRKKSVRPQIIFSSPRIDVSALTLHDSNYKLLKERAARRIDMMKQYVLNDNQCRSRLLSNYFGESDAPECGCCDICCPSIQSTPQLASRVDAMLRKRPMRMKELANQLQDISSEQLASCVRKLIDEGRYEIDSDLRISCKSSV